jgi:hypothetical protein
MVADHRMDLDTEDDHGSTLEESARSSRDLDILKIIKDAKVTRKNMLELTRKKELTRSRKLANLQMSKETFD